MVSTAVMLAVMKDVNSNAFDDPKAQLNPCCGIDPPNDFWGRPYTKERIR